MRTLIAVLFCLSVSLVPGHAASQECDSLNSDPVDLICRAPQVLYDQLIGNFVPRDEIDSAVLAGALLHAELEILHIETLAGNDDVRPRRTFRGQELMCLEQRYDGHPALGGRSFYLQKLIVSGLHQSAAPEDLIPSVRELWQSWNIGDRASHRAQENSRRHLHAAYPDLFAPPATQLPGVDALDRPVYARPRPADVFQIDRAAVAALLRARELSRTTDHIEWGGFILQDTATGDIVVPSPVPGTEDAIESKTKWDGLIEERYAALFDTAQLLCSQYQIVASYHVHPEQYDAAGRVDVLPNMDVRFFSSADITVALRQGVPEYVITPGIIDPSFCMVKVFTPPSDGRMLAPALVNVTDMLGLTDYIREVTVPGNCQHRSGDGLGGAGGAGW